jgi:Plavaka transposase
MDRHRKRCPKYLEYARECQSLNRRVADAKKLKILQQRQARRLHGSQRQTDIYAPLAGPSTHPTDSMVQDTAMSGPIMDSESYSPDSPYLSAPSPQGPPPPPPLPIATATGRPYRQRRLPARYQDVYPEAPVPVAPWPPPSQQSHLPPRISLLVRNHYQTEPNIYGVWKQYMYRPSYDPDASIMPQDLYRPHLSTFAPIGTQPEINDDVLRYKNKTVQLIMDWQNTRSSIKSNEEVTRLVHDVVLHPDFTVDELLNFSAARENQKADAAEHEATFPQAFQQIAVNIKVPSGNKDVPPKTLAIPGLSFRKITTLIRDEFEGPMFMKFHLSPFKLFCKHPHQNKDERIYSEMTDSDVFIDEHDKVQRAPTDDPACKREKVIAVLMFWSDATHLATFGTAKMWPVYMQFGNVSKYVRCQPTSGATKHVAYIPSLSDSVQDEIKHFHVKWDTQQRDILTHCRRELMHGVWKVLLDEDFLHATSYGMVVRCHDGIERRVYPRILTYSADYPEK